MLNITHYQRNANQNHHEGSPHTMVRMGPSKSLQTINVGEGVEKKEFSYTVGGDANQYSHYGEQCRDSLKNWKQNYHMTQQPHRWAYIPRKSELKETHVPQCSLQHCLQQLGHGSNLGVYSRQMDKEILVHIHNGILLSYKKKRTHLSQL